MAQQKEVQLDQENLCCSLCLDLLKDPVTVPCGHNYCSRCIEEYWDQDDQQETFSCPGCSQTFTPRPVLEKNTTLADMMDIENTGLQAVPPDHCYDGREDVVCDFCTRRKLKAVKTCLQCRVSYCDTHLQLHYQSPVFNNHKLVKAGKLRETTCAHHNEVKRLFCRIDQQCICSRCSVEKHKGHDTISAAVERAERQKTFDTSQQNIQQRIQERENDVKVLYQEVRSINHSADRAVDDSDTVFTNLTTAIKRRRTEVRELIRDQQKDDMSRVEEQMKRVEQELTELRRRHAELQQISHTEDPIQFLNAYTSLPKINEPTDPVKSHVDPLRSFEDVTVAASKMVSQIREKIDNTFKEEGPNILESVKRVDVLLSVSPDGKTRAENKSREPREPRARPIQKDKKIEAEVLETIKLEDVCKMKEMTKLFIAVIVYVIIWTHPIRSSSKPQVQVEPLGPRCLVQGHERRDPAWLGSWWWPETPEPKTRDEFLQYSCPITLDPTTADQHLSLSEGNKKVTVMFKKQSHPHYRDRGLVLSKEGLTGRCYWEVDWQGRVNIVVAEKDYQIVSFPIPAYSKRIGVYLDHSADTLSFYAWNGTWNDKADNTMKFLHRVNPEEGFTAPLYVGFSFDVLKYDGFRKYGDYAEFCDFQ